MDLMEEGLELVFEFLVFGALIELANEMTAGRQYIETELKRCVAQILQNSRSILLASSLHKGSMGTYHTSSMVPKTQAARVHHPMIWVIKTSLPIASGLLPGVGHVA